MSKFDFIKNKYGVSLLILLALLLADVLLHRGISRVMLPGYFTDKISPHRLPVCENELLQKDKSWTRSINNIERLGHIPASTAGIETDIFFNESTHRFEVYNDSTHSLPLDSLLGAYQFQKLSSNIWFHFMNLDSGNQEASLAELIRTKEKYGLNRKIIIESSSAALLKSFCDQGFYTGYLIPEFNPYQLKEAELIHMIDSIYKQVSRYQASALSGYYYQYPVLKKYFPNYPILTRVDQQGASLVSYFFNRQLRHDEMIKVVLFPQE